MGNVYDVCPTPGMKTKFSGNSSVACRRNPSGAISGIRRGRKETTCKGDGKCRA
jgi:hypothetical protein